MSLAEKLGINLAGDKVDYSQSDIAEFSKCAKDPIYFIEKYVTITNLDKGRQKFEMYDYQKKMTNAIWSEHYFEDGTRKRHNLIMMARQSGKTITVAANLLWYALFNSDKTIAILANKERIAIEILRRIKFAYQNLPSFLKIGVSEWNKKNVSLESGSRIISAATSEDAIRGESVNILYLDEFAFVRQEIADGFIASVFPTILSGETTKIIAVSTPNPSTGVNHFYYMVQEAEAGKSGFHFTKVLWNETPGHDDAWKARTIKEIGLRHWKSEYELIFFGASASLLIDSDILSKIFPKDPILLKYGGMLSVYEEPQKNACYVAGVDTSKGIGKDYSVATILKINDKFDIEVVAVYRNNKCDVYDFARIVSEIGEWYNTAKLMIENNDRGRIVAEKLYWQYEYEAIISDKAGELGINATHQTKSEADSMMKNYIENSYIKINDKNTITELSKYVEKKPDVFGADTKSDHDDCVAGLKWAVYYIMLPAFNLEEVLLKKENKKIVDEDFPVSFFDDSSIEDIDEMMINNNPKLQLMKEVLSPKQTMFTMNVEQSYIPFSQQSTFGKPSSYDCNVGR